jgi:hypothetical protein
MCYKEYVKEKRELIIKVGGSANYLYNIALHGEFMHAETCR